MEYHSLESLPFHVFSVCQRMLGTTDTCALCVCRSLLIDDVMIRCNSWHCDSRWQGSEPCTPSVLEAATAASPAAAAAAYSRPPAESFAGAVSHKPEGFSCRDCRNNHGNSNCGRGHSCSGVTGPTAKSTGNGPCRLPGSVVVATMQG